MFPTTSTQLATYYIYLFIYIYIHTLFLLYTKSLRHKAHGQYIRIYFIFNSGRVYLNQMTLHVLKI